MSTQQITTISIGLIFLLGGVALVLNALLRRRDGPNPWNLIDAAAALMGVILFSAGGMALYTGITDQSEGLFVPVMAFSTLGALGSLALVFLRAEPEALGLTRFDWRWFGLGLLLVLPFMMISAGWISLIESLSGPQDEQSIVETIRDPGSQSEMMAGLFYAVVVAPIAEEILFRGFLLGAIERAGGAALAVVASGVLFGLFHISDPITLVPLTLMGVCLGWLYIRSRSLWSCWAMHVGNNAVSLGFVVLAE
jgi:membrane protease YdiL (CAAX protease family)